MAGCKGAVEEKKLFFVFYVIVCVIFFFVAIPGRWTDITLAFNKTVKQEHKLFNDLCKKQRTLKHVVLLLHDAWAGSILVKQNGYAFYCCCFSPSSYKVFALPSGKE